MAEMKVLDAALPVTSVTAVAGTNDVLVATINTGQVWILTTADCVDITSATTRASIYVTDGTNAPTLAQTLSPAAYQATVWHGHVVLKGGWQIRALFQGCTAGDTLYARATAYRIL